MSKIHRIGIPTAIGTLFALGFTPSWASECDVLIRDALDLGETPTVSVDAAQNQVVLSTSRGSCRESPESWAARKLPIIKDGSGRARALVDQGQRLSGSAQEGLPGNVGSEREGVGGRFATSTKKCDLQLRDLAKPVRVQLPSGVYWLAQIFTIDLTGDGTIDNLGYRFRSESGGEDLTMQYFGTSGEIGVSDLPGLGLKDDSVIPRLCFGSVRLNPPGSSEKFPVEEPKQEEDPDMEDAAVLTSSYGNKTLWIGVGIAATIIFGAAGIMGLIGWIRRGGKSRNGVPLPSEFADEWEGDEEDDLR